MTTMITALNKEIGDLRLMIMAIILFLLTGIFAQTRQLTMPQYKICHLRRSFDGNMIACTDGITGYKQIYLIEIEAAFND